MQDLHSGCRDSVEDQVVANCKAAIARSQFVALAAHLGEISQHSKVVHQQVYEAIGGLLVVFGDVQPDVMHVLTRTPGQAVSHQGRSKSRSARASLFNSPARVGSVSLV